MLTWPRIILWLKLVSLVLIVLLISGCATDTKEHSVFYGSYHEPHPLIHNQAAHGLYPYQGYYGGYYRLQNVHHNWPYLKQEHYAHSITQRRTRFFVE